MLCYEKLDKISVKTLTKKFGKFLKYWKRTGSYDVKKSQKIPLIRI